MWQLFFVTFSSTLTFTFGVGEISNRKCREYSNAVSYQQMSPVLLPTNVQNRVSDCGIVEVPLIVGGSRVTSPKEFPHMALIGYASSIQEEMAWLCGGSLISELFVITAGHCMHSREKGPAQKVKLGMIDIDSTQVKEIVIAARIPHPQYRPPKKYNDIGLLKLLYAVQFSPYLRPACLYTDHEIPTPKAIAIGFGKTHYDSTTGSKHLMKVNLNLIPNFQCQKSFTSRVDFTTMPNGVLESLLCAGELAGGKDTCQGDSGGPLQIVLNEPYCMYSIIGVTSFGKFCGFADTPAIYSRISHFLEWIENTVWNNY